MSLLEKYVKPEKENKEKKVYYVRIDEDKAEILEKIAKEHNTKVSKIIQNFLEDIVAEYLQNQKK
jgi:LysM repeat protein